MSEQSSSKQASGFGERLAALVAKKQSQVVLGLDPNPLSLWPEVADTLPSKASRSQLAQACADQCQRLIDAVAGSCVAVKPQLACFERFGSDGWRALEGVVQYAKQADLVVIADGKRGDVPVTAKAYAEALLPGEQSMGIAADSVTANPLLGKDSVAPLIEAARESAAGVFLLVRTSNTGAQDVQDLQLQDGQPLWHKLAGMVDDLGVSATDQGLSDVGAVVGATRPEFIQQARELMPKAVFLMPGVGAQGGDPADLAAAFKPGKAAGLVTASRSIANAYKESGSSPATAASDEADRLRSVAWGIS